MKYLTIILLFASCTLFKPLELYQVADSSLMLYTESIRTLRLSEIHLNGNVETPNTPVILAGNLLATANAAQAQAVQEALQGCAPVRVGSDLSEDGRAFELHICAGPTTEEIDYLVYEWQTYTYEGDFIVTLKSADQCGQGYMAIDTICNNN
jgi:hypothetical protein